MTTAVAPVSERVWRAQPKQRVFLRCDEREALYGGAAGGGKTDALLIYNIRRRVRHPGSKGLFIRRSYADLAKEGSAIPRSQELLAGLASWNDQKHKWTFPNRSVLEFGYLESTTDKYHYQGAQYDDISFDELTQFEEDQYLYLFSRARTVRDDLEPQIRSATNPGGVGHAWVKERFINVAPPMTAYTDPETGWQRMFVPARVQDNTALMDADPGYLRALQQLPEAERRALLEGDWDVFAGQAFSEFRRETHTCKPFSIPDDWPRWVSVDGGWEHPAVALWWTRSRETGRYYVYRECVMQHTVDRDQARRIIELSGPERIGFYRADPSLWAKRSDTGLSTAEIYRTAGIELTQASNARVLGKRVLHALFKLQHDGLPALQLFATCLALVQSVTSMTIDEHDPEDVQKKAGDDPYDALRYGLPQATHTVTTANVNYHGAFAGQRRR